MRVRPADQPWATLYQQQADDAFNAVTAISDEKWRALRAPLPQIQYLPPRFGYPGYAARQWSVMQVFGITRTPSGRIPGVPQMKQEDRVRYSQSQATFEGSDRLTNNGDPLGLGAGGM